jgi:hypothetical protein
MTRRHPLRSLGLLLAVILPVPVLTHLALPAGLPGDLEAFWAAITAAHIGLVVRQRAVDWIRWLQDMAVGALMAGGAFVAGRLALQSGGGAVDPALLALLGTYLLLAWPAVNAL